MLCNLCGFYCNIDRSKELGNCQLDDQIYISYHGLHQGEEPFLVGGKGSGTIFFLGCNLRCQFCQNYQISRYTGGEPEISVPGLVDIFNDLKKSGALNINLVSPTPYVYQIAEAIKLAKQQNFDLPFVYNSHGYDSLEALKLMDGLIDIYLPDCKYSSNALAGKYSGVNNYVEVNQIALREMFRQVCHLKLNEQEIAVNGLVVRHLVLPNNIENSLKVLDFLAGFGREITISLMAQYHPLKSLQTDISPELQRTLKPDEYQLVVDHALKLGLENCLTQELESHQNYIPDFTQKDAFC